MDSKSRLDGALEAVKESPFDTGRWDAVLEMASRESVGKQREIWALVNAQFPSMDKYWLRAMDFEDAHGGPEKLEALFNKCLLALPTVPLWSFYLSYIRKAHSPPAVGPDRVSAGRSTILEAYEFALQNVGMDKDSGTLWMDYLSFIKSGDATSTFEQQQKMDLLRRVYQRAVKVPLTNVEAIWKEYDLFENGLNKLTAKKLIGDVSGAYMTARGALRELKGLLEPIETMSKTLVPAPVTWSEKEIKMITAWKRCIIWEKENHLNLEDTGLLSSRVTHAYKLAMANLRFFPEIWHDGAMYLLGQGKTDEAVVTLKSALEPNPRSLLLNFTLAEVMESAKKEATEISTLFDTLITALDTHLDALNAQFDKERDAMLASLTPASSIETPEEEWDGERREKERELARQREKEVDAKVGTKRRKEVASMKEAITLAWVTYMRVSRRTQNIKAARLVFSRARKSPNCTYPIYVASALMEFHCNKDAMVAGKVFEVGMRTINLEEDKDAAAYVEHYLDFLISMNDDNNTRALFERAVSSIPSDLSRDIWIKWLHYENQYGDLGNASRVWNRMKETYPGDIVSGRFTETVAEKWKVFNLNSVGTEDLGLGRVSIQARKIEPVVKAAFVLKPVVEENVKRLESLDAVTPEKFPRPDFSKYASYKPEGTADAGLGEKSLPGMSLMPERASVPDLSLIPDLPEPIMRLLGLLPPSIQYSGPRLPYEDIFALLLQSPIPLPPGILPPPPSLMSAGPPLMMQNVPLPQHHPMMPLGGSGLSLAPPPTLTPMIGQPPIMQPLPAPIAGGFSVDNGQVKKPRIDPRKRKAAETQGADVKRLA